MYLDHINVGWPLLDAGARFEAPIASMLWQSESVGAQGVSHLELPGPQPGFVEQVYEHELRAGDGGPVAVRLVNPRLGVYFELAYSAWSFRPIFSGCI